MPASPLLDQLGIAYSQEENTPREGGLLQGMGLDSSGVMTGAPSVGRGVGEEEGAAPKQSEAANFFEQSMGTAKNVSKGFFERNDILPTLADLMRTTTNILKSGGPLTKEIQINDPVRKDHLERWYDEGYEITPAEHFNYTRSGVLPSGVMEKITEEREKTEAMIESQGGQLRVISDAIKDNPSEMALELGKYIVSNPQYLMLPAAYAATAARVATSVGTKAAKVAGVAAETAVGAGIAAGGSALVSKQREGVVDPTEAKNAAMVGGLAGLLLGLGQALLRPLKQAGDLVQAKAGIQSEDIQAEIIRYSQKHRVSMQVAASRILEQHNLDPYSVVADINKVANELEATIVPGGPFVGPKSKRQIAQEKVAKKPVVKEGLGEVSPQEPPAGFVESRSVIDVPPAPSRARGGDPAASMFTSAAYRPNKGAVTEAILSMTEFADSPLGKTRTGGHLSEKALRYRYEKFHKDMIQANRDPNQIVTAQEMQDIMSVTSPTMRLFFEKQARRLDTKVKDLPKIVKEEEKALRIAGKEARKTKPAAREFRRKQKGDVDPRLVATMGVAGVAALVGYAKEHDPETAIGYALAAGSSIFALRVLKGWLKGRNEIIDHITSPPKSNLNLTQLYNKWQGEGAMRERRILNLRNSLYDISGGRRAGKKMREDITTALESGNISKLPKEAQEIAKVVRDEFDKIGKEIVKKGMVEESDLLDNYVAHLWQHPTKSTTELIDAIFENQPRGIATKSMHEKKRVIPTYAQGEARGLKPRTKDIADILAIYQKSVDQAQRNTELMYSLRRMKDPLTDKPLVVRGIENAPKSYRSVNHPRFAGYAVHPDLAPVVRSIFDVNEFSAPIRGVLATNFFLKRMAVSLSAFHAKALLGSAMMAGGMEKLVAHPIQSTKNLINTFRGKSPHLEMLRKGPAGDDIDLLLKNGLILNTVDDVGSDTFYGSLDDIRGVLDSTTAALGPVLGAPTAAAGKVVGAIKASNLWVDGMMWDRIYTGFKVSTALDKMQKLSSRYGGKISQDKLAAMTAEFTNDAFGGLNWLRLAENVTSRYGRQLAYNLVSRQGRATMQTALFAPDWTTANLRVFYKAFANKSPVQRKLYQGYQMRGMLMFLLMADVANTQLAGHHIWDNKDPTSIELGDGTRMVLSKQFMEPYKWATKPSQEAINKMSTMVSTGLQVMTGKKWLAGPGKFAPPIENSLTHVLSKATPIWLQQGISQKSMVAGAKSLAGFPTYGVPSSGRGLQTTAPASTYGGGGKSSTVISPKKSGGLNILSGLKRTAAGIFDAVSPNSVDTPVIPENIREGVRNQPRGIANNNPLNIEQGANWQGMAKDQTKDPRFAQFDDPKYGIRAAVKILQAYNRRGVDTLSSIINTWAPPTENNTQAYIDTVSKLSGIGPNTKIDLKDETIMIKLIRAMVSVENGHNFADYYTDDIIRQGVNLAQ